MIPEAVIDCAMAISAWLDDVDVDVLPYPPDAVAGPVVWVELDGLRFVQGHYRVGVRARCLAAPGTLTGAMPGDLYGLADRVVAALATAAAPVDVAASSGTVRVGEHSYPTIDVTTTVPKLHCDLPERPTSPRVPTEATHG